MFLNGSVTSQYVHIICIDQERVISFPLLKHNFALGSLESSICTTSLLLTPFLFRWNNEMYALKVKETQYLQCIEMGKHCKMQQQHSNKTFRGNKSFPGVSTDQETALKITVFFITGKHGLSPFPSLYQILKTQLEQIRLHLLPLNTTHLRPKVPYSKLYMKHTCCSNLIAGRNSELPE